MPDVRGGGERLRDVQRRPREARALSPVVPMLERGGYSYAGGKGGAGVLHKIIGAMPRHRVYVEPFLGGGAVLAAKRPAEWTIAGDVDGDVVQLWRQRPAPGRVIVQADALRILSRFLPVVDASWLIYLDPPYLLSTRSRRRIYRHEFSSDAEHRDLLSLILTMPAARVMVSGYESSLYTSMLQGWRRIDFTGQTRGGPRRESLWCNFAQPVEFHDPRFCGSNFRERERVKRRRHRWIRRLQLMKPFERQLVREALLAVDDDAAW